MNILTRKEIDQRALRWTKHLTAASETLRNRQSLSDENAYRLVEENFWNSFLLTSNRLHCLYDELMLRIPAGEQQRIYDLKADQMQVFAKAMDGMLLLCCPHPPKRRNDYYKGNRFVLNHEIAKIQGELTLFPRKTIHIVNVYSTDYKDRAAILDFDNYDLKSLIDEACRLYPCTDHPLTTTIHLSTVVSDLLPARTYLVVTDSAWSGDLYQLIKKGFTESGS